MPSEHMATANPRSACAFQQGLYSPLTAIYVLVITIYKTILQGPWVYWLLRIYTIRVCPKDQFSSGEAQINMFYVDVRKGHNLFVLRFYGTVNPMGSCRARSVYLTTRLLGRLSPLSG